MKKIKLANVKIRKDLDGYTAFFKGNLFFLNKTGYEILSLCSGNAKEDVIDEMEKKYGSVEKDVNEFLKKLEGFGIIQYE